MKKFPRFEDPFCLGKQEKARSIRFNEQESLQENITSQGDNLGRDTRTMVKPFADPNTPKVTITSNVL